MAEKVWFLTGASRGFGREWTTAALERGDQVAATARRLDDLDDLVAAYGPAILPLRLDVTDRAADFAAVRQAHDHFGRLDVVVNNAGYGQLGAVEELSEREARDQMEANFFGALWVTQAALPYLRDQGYGHIVQVSSIGGITASCDVGMYDASKWALEGLSQAMAAEVASFGIKVTLVEPGGFATGWRGSAARPGSSLAAYEPVREQARQRNEGLRFEDPTATAAAVLEIVDSAAPPLRVLLGTDSLRTVTAEYERRLATWREWPPVAEPAQG